MQAIQNFSSGSGGKNILSGTEEPTAATGVDGDIYLQYIDYGNIADGYTALIDISTGATVGAYINTGLTSAGDVACEIKLKFNATPSNNTWFYGAFGSSKGSPILGYQSGRVEGYIVTGGQINSYHTDYATYKVDESGIAVDGVLKQAGSWGSIAVGTPLYLFSRGGDNASINNTTISYCKMWKDGELVRYFIPAKRNSDNAVGMYDMVNNIFYANAGTQSFSAGEVRQGTEIESVYLKKSGAWQDLIGSDINDVISV